MRMLVSVRDVAEAREALRAGVDFIDLKEPASGALGGLALPVIRAVVAALRAGEGAENAPRAEVGRGGDRYADGVCDTGAATQAHARRRMPMISATIGDLPPDALDAILARATAVGGCGVDLVKVGVPGRGAASCPARSWRATARRGSSASSSANRTRTSASCSRARPWGSCCPCR